MDFPAAVGGSGFEAVGITSSGDSTGTTITSNGSANTKGSYTELIASSAFNYEAIYVAMEYNQGRQILCDIAVGGAGSEVIVVPDLWRVKTGTGGNRLVQQMLLPVGIPAGSRISARSADDVGGAAWRLSLLGISGDGLLTGRGNDVWSAVTSGSSRGITVDPGGSANTKGSWTQLVASTSFLTRHLSLVIGNYNIISNSYDGWFIDVAVGGAGSEVVLVENWYVGAEPGDDLARSVLSLPVSIPAGTRISARAQSNDTTVNRRELAIAAYGVS